MNDRQRENTIGFEPYETNNLYNPNGDTKLIIEGREFRLIKDDTKENDRWYCHELGIVITKHKASSDRYEDIGDYGREKRILVCKKDDYYFGGNSCRRNPNSERILEQHAFGTVEYLKKRIDELEAMSDEHWKKQTSSKEEVLRYYGTRLEKAIRGHARLKAIKENWLKKLTRYNEHDGSN